MNDPMTMLKADHREVAKMLRTLSESDEGPEREQIVQQLQAALALHMQLEEQLVYPLVIEHVGEDDEEEAEVEHRLAREGLQQVVDLVSAPGFGAAVEMLQAGIQHHVKEEETEILPALKEAMERDQWRELGDSIASAKAEAGHSDGSDTPRSSRRSSRRRPRTADRAAKSTSGSNARASSNAG